MITRLDLDERVREWNLADHVVEKDYVIGWVLWGIGTHPRLSKEWAFKGGTCLKKCYYETYRFSEDLDFTVLPGGAIAEAEVRRFLTEVLHRVGEESGLNFGTRELYFKSKFEGQAAEARIYYFGPRGAPSEASISLDLSAAEVMARPTELREIGHSYPDALPAPGRVRCYSFAEAFAEKIRAMGQRGRPRDLYDIVHLFRRRDLGGHPQLVREILEEKCSSKKIPVPTLESVTKEGAREEIEAAWENMLAHQLMQLPPFGVFWNELPNLFAWLKGELTFEELPPIALDKDEDETWRPPELIATWGRGVPLEVVRFAASNLLCVELGYNGTKRLVEPYSLRRTRNGNLILHARKVEDDEHRSYRVDRMESLKASSIPFSPRYPVEFSQTGSIAAKPTATAAREFPGIRRATRTRRVPAFSGPKYVFACTVCGKHFERKEYDANLREHKRPNKHPPSFLLSCPGRTGRFVRMKHR